MSFAKRLKNYREEAGLGLSQIAGNLQMADADYAQYEDAVIPPEKTMIQIAKSLNMSYLELKVGRETVLLDLLHSYLLSVAMGEADALEAYESGVEDKKPYQQLAELCDMFFSVLSNEEDDEFVDVEPEGHPFFTKYLAEWSYPIIVELGKRYRYAEQATLGEVEPAEWFGEFDFSEVNLFDPLSGDRLNLVQVYRLAFLYTAMSYLEVRADGVHGDVCEAEGREMSQTEAMQIFALQVFVPFYAIVHKILNEMIGNNAPLHQMEGYLYGVS